MHLYRYYVRLRRAFGVLLWHLDGRKIDVGSSCYKFNYLLPNIMTTSNSYETFLDLPYTTAIQSSLEHLSTLGII